MDHGHHCDCNGAPPLGRRRFLTLAALGGGAALLSGLPGGAAHASGSVDALLLTCMDYRLVDDVVRYMDGRGMNGKYDHVILAGASLGALTERMPAWGNTFWQHLDVAIQLHKVHRVIVMDHRDCGAYRVFLDKDLAGDRAAESAAHAAQLSRLAAEVRSRHPGLEVELLLMSLDGKVETVSA